MTEALAVSWGGNVRRLRSTQGISQQSLADACRVTQATISRIETGAQCPNDATKIGIAAALSSSVEELFPFPSAPVGLAPAISAQRRASGRIGAYVTNSRHDPRRNTEKARQAMFERFIKEVDPNNELPREEQERRATFARKAHLARMTQLAREARRRKSEPQPA